MRNIIAKTIAAATMIALTGTAIAQTAKVVGLVTDTANVSVVLAASSGLLRAKAAGDRCSIRPKDLLVQIGTAPDGRIIAQRELRARMPAIGQGVCKHDAQFFVDKAKFDGYVAAKAKADADAAKAAADKAAARGKRG